MLLSNPMSKMPAIKLPKPAARKNKPGALMAAIMIIASITALPSAVMAQSAPAQLLADTKQAKAEKAQRNLTREAGFKKSEAELRKKQQALIAYIAKLKAENTRLAEQFQQNEHALAEKEKQLHLATGSLGELFGVVRQSAKELEQEQYRSVASIAQQTHLDLVDEIVQARTLPSKRQLYGLWHAIQQQIDASGNAELLDIDVTSASGETEKKKVIRLGSFGLADENGYVVWNGEGNSALTLATQPNDRLTTQVDVTAANAVVALDPTRGSLLEQLALAPTLSERIKHGGIVGKIIIVLMAFGILLGLLRGFALLATKTKITKQLKDPLTPQNSNALGRILNIYREDTSPNVEALELRLLEAVMDEQQNLERGLSMIKLLAALAPMLGLLGTVTGMIETFQTITQLGNAEPRVMAGGISMALVTTVLGLVAAMPLLLIHNVLSSQAEAIRNIIERQSVGLVAERAEKTQLESKVV